MILSPEPHRDREVPIGLEQAQRFLVDKDAVLAEINGVSKRDYLAWIGAGFCVRCAGVTKSKRRCRQTAVGGNAVSALEWVAKQGDYCAVHGGDR